MITYAEYSRCAPAQVMLGCVPQQLACLATVSLTVSVCMHLANMHASMHMDVQKFSHWVCLQTFAGSYSEVNVV